MSKSQRPSESEAMERLAREAEDHLAHTPEPTPQYLTDSVEQDGEEQEALDTAQERVNDALASDKTERRIVLLEEAHRETNTLLKAVLQKLGFKEAGPRDDGSPIIPPAPTSTGMRTIYIAEGTSNFEKEPVWVSVNGDGRFLPRGKYVLVTPPELEVLLSAKIEGQHYPVVNDAPLARKPGRIDMTLSLPVPYEQPRFAVLVQPGL